MNIRNLFAPGLFFAFACAWIFVLANGNASSSALAAGIEALLLLVMGAKFRLKRDTLFVSGLLFSIVLLQLYAVYDQWFYWEDFVRAVKPWLYLALFFSTTNAVEKISVTWLRRWLFLFLVGYIVSTIQGVPRPYLIIENNFELPLVITIWAFLVVNDAVKLRSIDTAAALTIAVLSMSRSGVVSAMVVLALLLVRDHRQNGSGYFSINKGARVAWLLPIVVYATFMVLESRITDLESIDRVRFFAGFLDAFRDSGVVGVIFGSGPLAEIPRQYCDQFSYYLDALAGEYGQCYSVVWHAAAIRLLYDFGVVGLILAYYLVYVVLTRRYSKLDAIIGLAPMFLAGLSVGGIYNVFAFLGVFIYFIGAKSTPVRSSHRSLGRILVRGGDGAW